MSFDIFLGCFSDGETASFPKVLAWDAFAPVIAGHDPAKWNVADCNAEIWLADAAEIDSFMVSRPPPGDPHHPFWAALLDLMRQTRTVLYWPSGGPLPHCVVADLAVIPHLPHGMIDALGDPGLVHKPEAFWDFIAASD